MLKGRRGSAGDEATPSTAGAEVRIPRSTRTQVKRESGTPVPLPMMRCVAGPATAAVERRKASFELWMARSMETTTPTPRAIPMVVRTISQG
jgi:hypothetical protein